jgi:putative transposase
MIKRAYKYRFYPQNDLKVILAKTFGCVRFVYNQTLDFSEKHYANKIVLESQGLKYKPLTGSDRVNFVKSLKDSIEDDKDKPNFGQLKYPWLNEVSSIALQQAARHLNDAYSRFFKGQSGKPQFKSKHHNHHSFTITGKNSLHFDKDFNKNNLFYLPKYDKPLNIKWGKSNKAKNKTTKRNFNYLAVSSITVSQNPSGQYFISFLVEEEITSVNPINDKTSFDLGLKTMAKVYDGKIDSEGKPIFYDFNLPDLLKAIDKKLRKAQRVLSKKTKGSKNRDKQRLNVARLHQKRVNIITDYYQKKSTIMVNENQEIILEDLNISGMKRNRKLSRAIHNVAWKRFIEMILYKAKWHNRIISRVNRFYPSSKTCSSCGHIYHGLKLSHREWTCEKCNAHHDRDENACLNLFNYNSFVGLNGKNQYIAGTANYACGGNVRPKTSKKIISKKSRAVSNEAGIHVL